MGRGQETMPGCGFRRALDWSDSAPGPLPRPALFWEESAVGLAPCGHLSCAEPTEPQSGSCSDPALLPLHFQAPSLLPEGLTRGLLASPKAPLPVPQPGSPGRSPPTLSRYRAVSQRLILPLATTPTGQVGRERQVAGRGGRLTSRPQRAGLLRGPCQ